MHYTLERVTTPADWAAYHAIRKAELFDARGRTTYNDDHPDEFKLGNVPFVLKYNDNPIATTRFDFLSGGSAALRLVAVTAGLQGRGHGAALMQHLKAYAHSHNVVKLVLNANPTAIGYYEKFGFYRENWNPSELTGISANSIQMVCDLTDETH